MIVRTDNKHYKNIADKIREHTGLNVMLHPEDMVRGVDDVHSAGIVIGKEQGEAACRARHFSQIVVGDGSTELKFHVPFEPDTIIVSCHDPAIRATKGIISAVQFEPRAFGQIAGFYSITSGPASGTSLGSYVNGLNPANTLSTRYVRNDDGEVVLKNFVTQGSSPVQGYFGNGLEYIVAAAKVIEKSDRVRIEASLRSFPSNPAAKYIVYLRKDMIEAEFPGTEWNDFIGNAPMSMYTFTLI